MSRVEKGKNSFPVPGRILLLFFLINSNEIHMFHRVLQIPQIFVDLVHPAVDLAVFRERGAQELLHETFPFFSVPDFGERLFINIAEEIFLFREMNLTSPDIASGIEIGPEGKRITAGIFFAGGVVPLHGIHPEND